MIKIFVDHCIARYGAHSWFSRCPGTWTHQGGLPLGGWGEANEAVFSICCPLQAWKQLAFRESDLGGHGVDRTPTRGSPGVRHSRLWWPGSGGRVLLLAQAGSSLSPHFLLGNQLFLKWPVLDLFRTWEQ